MGTLINFEIVKFFKHKKNIFMFVIFILLIFVFIITNDKLDKRLFNSKLDILEYEINSVNNALNYLKVQYKETEKEELKSNIDQSEKLLNDLYEQKKSILEKDWLKELEIEIKLDKEELKGIKNKALFSGTSIEDLEFKIIRNEYLLNNKIEPINLRCSMTAFNFLRLSAIFCFRLY